MLERFRDPLAAESSTGIRIPRLPGRSCATNAGRLLAITAELFAGDRKSRDQGKVGQAASSWHQIYPELCDISCQVEAKYGSGECSWCRQRPGTANAFPFRMEIQDPRRFIISRGLRSLYLTHLAWRLGIGCCVDGWTTLHSTRRRQIWR